MALDPSVIDTLTNVSTATLSTVLLKKGLRNTWIRGTRPIRDGQPRIAGEAFTLRFVPAREDLATPDGARVIHRTAHGFLARLANSPDPR